MRNGWAAGGYMVIGYGLNELSLRFTGMTPSYLNVVVFTLVGIGIVMYEAVKYQRSLEK